MSTSLRLQRTEILAFRRCVSALDRRLPVSTKHLRHAAWAGLQDSMPRAAQLSIHARVTGSRTDLLQDPSLLQIWGPRFNTYVVAKRDWPVFTLGRLPDDGAGRQRARELAKRLAVALGGGRMTMRAAANAIGERDANRLRYATATGRIGITWDGARQPEVWLLPEPAMDPRAARLELARRYLHVFGPCSAGGFSTWAGIGMSGAVAAFAELRNELIQVKTPIGDRCLLRADEPLLTADPTPPAPARLLPSGDTWYLLQGLDRELLVPDAKRRGELWTSRVWPGALLVGGEVVGTWRRAAEVVTLTTWRRLARAERAAVEQEGSTLPLPGIHRPMTIRWGR